MAVTTPVEELAGPISFLTDPSRYRHWHLRIEGSVATLALDVDEAGGLAPGYVLKLNSYDLGVDIELADAVQRLRFEHPEVRAVVLTSDRDKVFSAGANIGMLARAAHQHKVNFCKFTNETRLAMEDATACSGQTWITALNGTASGGGYELALATDHIILVDDNASAVSLPEVALLGVLPGTGGLTRMVDKRHVRRDRADVFATKAEGMRGQAALAWGLVDEVVPRSRFAQAVAERAERAAAGSDGPTGIELTPLERHLEGNSLTYLHISAEIDPSLRTATVEIAGPGPDQPADLAGVVAAGAKWWPLAVARELDDLVLHLRFNRPEIGTIVWTTSGHPPAMAAVDNVLLAHGNHWLVREVVLYWKRVLKRVDLTARSLVALVEPGSCFAGTLAELALGADRSYMLAGPREDDDQEASVMLTAMNFGPLPMGNGLTRLESRFLGDRRPVEVAEGLCDTELGSEKALEMGLVTFAPDDLDWDDEVRLALEERAAFSPDALSGMEANHRFCGPETMETKIFGRLSAWQNWIFQRPNAHAALERYGTGTRASFDPQRV